MHVLELNCFPVRFYLRNKLLFRIAAPKNSLIAAVVTPRRQRRRYLSAVDGRLRRGN